MILKKERLKSSLHASNFSSNTLLLRLYSMINISRYTSYIYTHLLSENMLPVSVKLFLPPLIRKILSIINIQKKLDIH